MYEPENETPKEGNYRESIEGVLTSHMNRITIYRETNLKHYASSVETLILFCPDEIRQLGFEKMRSIGLQRCQYESITPDRMKLYDELLIFINQKLEAEGMIFKRSSFVVGHD